MSSLEGIYAKSPIFLQTLFLNAKAMELYLERYGNKFDKLFTEFERNQWLTLSDLGAYQDERLRKLIHHVYTHVPYYKEVMTKAHLTPNDIRVKEDLPKLPLLTKADIRQHASRLIDKTYPKWLLRHGHTSGTTGTPLDVYYDIQTCMVHHVADWRQKSWAGLRQGQAYASLQGRVIVPTTQQTPPFWRHNYVNNQLFLSSFHLTEKNLPHYFDKLTDAQIQFIEGYPSTLYILALFLLKQHQTFPLTAVFTSSETLFDYQRHTIEKAFTCKVFDFYGMAERAVYASECQVHSGHHLNSDYGITEFVNSDHVPVTDGQAGRIVATSLHNFAMPLIRYETNDASAKNTTACLCGRGFPLMENVTTKQESIVTLPDGRLISPSVLTHPFKPMHNIAESQIIQESLHELRVKIVKRAEYNGEDEKLLIAAFHERLGQQIRIIIDYVDTIPREPSGKFRWVISKVPVQFS